MDEHSKAMNEMMVHLSRFGDTDLVYEKLVLKHWPPVFERTVQHLKQLANQSKLSLPAVFTTVAYFGNNRLGNLRSVAETLEFASILQRLKDKDKFNVWSPLQLVETLDYFSFLPPRSRGGKKALVIKIDDWCFYNSEVLSESLGIEEPRAVCATALIAGVLGYDGLPQSNQEEIIHIIEDFSRWVYERLVQAKGFYRLVEDEVFHRLHQAWLETHAEPHWEPWSSNSITTSLS
jgi:hypothetical protein